MQANDRYKDSGIEWLGEIPEHWEVRKLNSYLRFITGGTPSSGNSALYDGDLRWVTIGDLGQGKYVEKFHNISIKGVREANIPVTSKGSLLCSFKLSVGQVAFAPFDLYTNEAIASFQPGKDVSLNYYYYSLPITVIHNANENIYGAKLLNQELIKNSKIIYPPLPEQEAIATFLDDKCGKIDEAVRIRQQQIEKLKELRQITILNAVTKGINPEAEMKDSGIDWIGEIPKHWEVKRLKYVLKAQGRIGFKGYSTSDLVDEGEGALVLGASHMDWDGNIKLEEPVYLSWKKYFESPEIMVSKGDIIIVQRGSTCGKVAAVLKDFGEVTINPSLVLLKNIIANNIFCFFAIKCSLQYILALMSKTAIPMISQEQINNISIAMPSLAEQEEIVSYLEDKTFKIDAAIARKTEQIAKLNEYKQSLINEVVTGKVKVTD